MQNGSQPPSAPAHSDPAVASGLTPAAAIVLEQTGKVLEPLVHLLLEHGITYPRLADLLKGIFIDTALTGRKPRAGRITDSTVAVITGIHRKDVKRLRSPSVQLSPRSTDDGRHSLASIVVTRWLTDPACCDSNGQPLPLHRRDDDGGGFEALVKKISRDVHPRSVLDELIRLQLVDVDGDQVSLKSHAFVPNNDVAQMLEYLGANLHDHAAAAVRNMMGSARPFLEQSIFSDTVQMQAVDELADLARKEWTRTLKSFVPEVARREMAGEPPLDPHDAEAQPAARVRLGMYFFAEPQSATSQTPSMLPNDRSAS